jgi:D-alanyl-D-alanine carboxypeptidase
MKYPILLTLLLIFGLTSCSVENIDLDKFNQKDAAKSDLNANEANTNTDLSKDTINNDTTDSSSSLEGATETETNTDESQVLDLNHPNTEGHQDYIVTQTDITGYHDLITDVSNFTLPVDLSDPRLSSLITHLGQYNYNLTLNQIGEVTDPDSLYLLTNKLNHLPADYIPKNLVEPAIRFSFDSPDEKRNLQEPAALALEALFTAASDADLNLFAVSGYRSYERQEAIYNNKVSSVGLTSADAVSARPGHSEHQSGLAMDISCESIGFGLEYAFGSTPEGLWVAAHAHEFGFIIRYPEDKTDITGYNYEPWHLRYIGIDLADYIYEHQLTLEQLYASILNQL